jgi:dihydroxyacetone kinase
MLTLSYRKGYRRISPLPLLEDLVEEMLASLLDPKDEDRSFVKFRQDDEVVLLVNNFGGVSVLEIGAIVQESLSQLGL